MHILTMLLLLSVLVLVHELGHFGVARMFGIRVDRFGFGLPFGPTLFEKKWGETTVCIHALLLGGYVAFPDDDPDSDIPKDHPDRISNRPVWQRALVISAGVAANALIAYLIVLFVAAASHGVPSGKYDVYIEGLQSDKTLSANYIGFKKNDKITSINGMTVDSPIKFIQVAQLSKKFDNYASTEKISDQGKKILDKNPSLKDLKPNQSISKGIKIDLPVETPENAIILPKNVLTGIKKVNPEGEILSANQQKLRNSLENKKYYISDGNTTVEDLVMATSDTVHPLLITVNRNGKNVELKAAYPNAKGMIGVKLRSEEVIIPVNNPVTAVTKSWGYLSRNVYYMVSGLGMIVTGQIPLQDLHGIVAITKIGGDIIQNKGMWDGLLLTALISIDLAIVNLLPIPALDGGHLFFLLIETLRGKPVEEKIQEAFAKYGFAFLIGLMILIIFNDIFALVTDKL
ncbi:MAG: RIP metalloprotease RseP [Candidatus Gastranaerophilales bacterium]|nr:RIP metalloprotease RseP [Candidatus Gastranaerophilales bacterium]